MKRVLLTGFDAFGGESINPSWEAVRQLDGMELQGHTVRSFKIPTVFHTSISRLKQYIDDVQPCLIICVGQAGGRSDITVERVAINMDDARIPDNEGQQPIDIPIVEGGPDAYFSTLPIKAVVNQLLAENIPASVSQTAGTFVCNHLFYGLMHILASQSPVATRGGFVHIPFVPQQSVKHRGQPSMSLETAVRGLRFAIMAAVNHERDIKKEDGALH
ncbi:pyroglutamyl-peptidase I [Alicyclobacillus sp. SO9]|uniref:pyroglutamyl-peptidase I n=1 Tax=Alicyclobacillus sp. SO9 TaxID=2665646 RepID=UPI0018E7720B|nr:pyroglutamyl-peptidase I [Alicyclobacillus sp. SO9]QQE80176.1 pyroglutamyl-peptidase I [Alicyclobacillus sp. SO9]